MLTLAEVKEHLRVEHDDEDALIGNLLTAGYTFAENYTNTAILDAEYIDKLDDFQKEIMFKHENIQSITSITYYDADDVQQTQTDYFLDTRKQQTVLTAIYDEEWPDTNNNYENVVITYQAGYATIPDQINQAVLLVVGSLYEQRENHIVGMPISSVPVSAEYLLNPYRLIML